MPVTINGSSGIDAVQPGVIVQADLATNVAGSGPCFSAYQTGVATTLLNATYTKIALQGEDFDVGGYFDATTNYRFQPAVAGYYQINGNVLLALTGSAIFFSSIYKNGSPYCRGAQSGVAGSGYGSSISALIYFNGSTDYIELWAYQNSGGTISTDPAPSYRANRLDGNLVRAA